MDFPGTINNDFEHFMHHVLDITKSLAYHGFKKIILLNGHGSNMPNLDLVARRTNLETDAECLVAAWWNLLTVDKEFLPRWRQSKFPGGCAHACELETSLYLYLDGDNVRKDKIKNGTISFNEENSPFNWVDLFAAGPGHGDFVDQQLLRDRACWAKRSWPPPEKGRQVYEEAVKQLVRFVTWFKDRAATCAATGIARPPTMPMPWGQRPVAPPKRRADQISRRDLRNALACARLDHCALACASRSQSAADACAAAPGRADRRRPTPSSSRRRFARC